MVTMVVLSNVLPLEYIAYRIRRCTGLSPSRTSGNALSWIIYPHGDSSVYDAMVRLSQDWKLRHVLIEMHGNNGSIIN
jgi:hypothetical protein